MSGKSWRILQAERAEQRRQDASALAASYGARIYPFGVGWRVVGPTISMFIADLAYLEPEDFLTHDRRG